MPHVLNTARHSVFGKLLAVFALLLFCDSFVQAQAVPTLSSTAPLVIQPGHEVIVTLAGQHLARTSSTLIAEMRGLNAIVRRSSATTQPIRAEDAKLQLTLTADPEAA